MLGLRALLAAVLPLLAACGSGGSGGGLSGQELFEARVDEYQQRQLVIAGTIPTDLDTLPLTGSASYRGVAGLAISDGAGGADEIMGDLDLDIAFATNLVDAEMTDFVDSNGQSWAGALGMADAPFDRSASGFGTYAIEGQVTGTLTPPGEDALDVTGLLLGGLAGPDADYVSGTISGLACNTADCFDAFGGYNGVSTGP